MKVEFCLLSICVLIGLGSFIMINNWNLSQELGIKCNYDYSRCGYYDGNDNPIPLDEALARERIDMNNGMEGS